jgi:hypothetical protein
MEEAMPAHNLHSSLPWRSCCWAFSLLALFGLAACGASGQGAVRATSAAPRATEATAAGVSQPTAGAPQPPIAATIATSPEDVQPSSSPTLPLSPSVQPIKTAKPVPATLPHAPPNPIGTPATAPTAAPAAASLNTGTWQTYHSAQGGFQVDYPANWTASERGDASATLTTTFAPPGGGAGIAVIVRPGGPVEDNSDISNVRCRSVTIGGLFGKRCLDTIAFSVSTTLVGQDKTYTIAASTKRADQSVYQRLLESFVASS